MLPAFTILVLVAFYLLYRVITRKYSYWSSRNVPHLKPWPLLGNYGPYILMKKYSAQLVQEICQKFPDQPYVGAYFGTEPTLIIQDPKIIELVTTKDFYYFNSREIAEHTHKEVMSQNLFFTHGDQWKVIRKHMAPQFSAAKMKNMFPLIEKCCLSFEQYIEHVTGKSMVVDMRNLMARLTIACITSCGFGAEVDTLNHKIVDNPFLKMGKLVFLNTYTRGFMTVARSICPTIFYGLGFKNFPDEMIDFFKTFVTDVFEARKYSPSTRNDFIDLMLTLRQQKSIVAERWSNTRTGRQDQIELPITDNLLVAQCVLFFAAGYETSSGTLTFLLYELAKKPEAQQRVLDEVDTLLKKHGNRLNYESVRSELPYTTACIDEALRLHPGLGLLTRELVEDYKLPDGLQLNKGVRIHIPVYHLQRKPEFFPEPEVFRPERFLGEHKNNIIPHTYMPFGDGARICIGERFGKMQMLAGLVTLLKKYRAEMTDSTPRTLTYDPRTIVTAPVELVNLRLVTREGWEGRRFQREEGTPA